MVSQFYGSDETVRFTNPQTGLTSNISQWEYMEIVFGKLFAPGHVWIDVAVLVGFIIFLRIVVHLGLRFVRYEKR